MGYVEYSSNNSGGRWWLKDDDWLALERAGWKVAWGRLGFACDDAGNYIREIDGTPRLLPHSELPRQKFPTLLGPDGRWLGALAKTAYRAGLGLREAVAEWESITHGDALDAGCNCCGQPHSFTEYDDKGARVASGPTPTGRCEW